MDDGELMGYDPELSLRFIESNYKTLFALIQLGKLEIGPCEIGERVNNALDGLDKPEEMIAPEGSESEIDEVRIPSGLR